MSTPAYSIVYSAQLFGASSVPLGAVLIKSASDLTKYAQSTTANRGTRRSEGIAITAYSDPSLPGSVQMQQSGTIDASISLLGTTSGLSLVRVSTSGFLERIATGSVNPSTDDVCGYAEADGSVHLYFGLPLAEIITLAGGGGGGGGAPTTASYVTMSSDGTLSAERVLTAGNAISITDGGANSTVTVSNTTYDATYVTLTNHAVLPNERVLTAGAGISISDSGAGGTITITNTGGGGGGGAPTGSAYVTLALDGTLTAERVLTAGNSIGLVDAGANSTVTVNNTSYDATYVTLSNHAVLPNERVLTAGSGISISDAGAGSTVTISATGGGAPVGASYVTLGLDGTLTNERVLTNGTGISISDGGANGNVTITNTGLLAVAGSAGEIQVNSGSFSLAAATNITAGSNYIAYNSSATTGYLRLGGTGSVTQMTWRPSSTDITVLSTDSSSSAIQLGDTVNAATYCAGTSVYLFSSQRAVSAGASKIQTSLPVYGDQSYSVPFRFSSSTVTISGADGSTITASAAQAECVILILQEGGGGGGSSKLVLPNYSGAFFIIYNGTARIMTIKVSGGTGFNIAGGKTALTRCDGSDYVRVTGDA